MGECGRVEGGMMTGESLKMHLKTMDTSVDFPLLLLLLIMRIVVVLLYLCLCVCVCVCVCVSEALKVHQESLA